MTPTLIIQMKIQLYLKLKKYKMFFSLYHNHYYIQKLILKQLGKTIIE